ncbi:single-strand binding family protein [Bifidobacterium bombi DSM 19703]|uniref:Single-stranded DNA-binding protein n=2 Tax=Bifidobacterium bombi TaxID=471511 RepID=A0A080N2J9_9BIFI|nr:single-strand binding family protein [Bifidobacterium bombi DSM 19703]
MQHAMTTISGYVGTEPVVFGKQGGTPAVSFRLAYTPKFFQSSTGQWQQRATVWMTVKAFRSLALNVRQSVHKGDAVIVTGALGAEEWTKDGQNHSRTVLQATGIGHDLSLGTSVFTKRASAHDPHGSEGVGSDEGRLDGREELDSGQIGLMNENTAGLSVTKDIDWDTQEGRRRDVEGQPDEFCHDEGM